MISLVYLTYRLGGFDLLLDSLKKQTVKTGWELIVVDDYPDRDLSMLFEEDDIPLGWYGKSKVKKHADTRFGVANAMNTGYLHAKGDVIVYVHDYSWLNENAMKLWQEAFATERRKLVVGIGNEYNYVGEFALNGYSVFNPPYTATPKEGETGRFVKYHQWIPEEFEMFYSGYPREFMEAIDGFDEMCDYDITLDYPTVVAQAKALGYKLEVDELNWVNIVNHREWTIGNDKMWNVRKV
jgi:glycosyltransferase involved in cell wall biosynthesis